MLKLNREKTNTRICLETKDHSGTARRGHRFHRGTRDGQTPHGMTSTCDQVEGGKGGGTKSWDTSTDAGTGREAQRKGVEAGGFIRRPGGRRFMPVEEVGSRCKREGQQK